MKIKSIFPAIALSLLFLLTSGYLGTKIYQYANEYREAKNDYLKVLFFKERLGSKSEWSNGLKLSGEDESLLIKGFNKLKKELLDGMNWADRKEKAEKVFLDAQDKYSQAVKLSYFAGGTGLAYFLISFLLYIKSPISKKALAYSLLILASVGLAIGIFVPMMEFEAFITDFTLPKEPLDLVYIEFQKTFEGDIYFMYENKSLMSLVSTLFSHGNYSIGIVVLLFSIVVPIMKISLSLLALFGRASLNNKIVYFIINKLAKWSMLDVLLVAVYMGYLSFNSLSPGVTSSTLLVGLYFFLAYCLLSIISSYFLKNKHRLVASDSE